MQIHYPATKIARKNGGRNVKAARSRRLSYPSGEKSASSHLMVKDSHITAERQLAEALQIEKNKLQSVIDAMTDGLIILNYDFNIALQNDRSKASFGAHVGEKCYRAFQNRNKVCEGCPVAMTFQDGMPHTSEVKDIASSGVTTYWEITTNPIKDDSGKVIMCLEFRHEVTTRKKAEKALQESQKFVTSLLENAPHATVVINADTSVRYVNPAWERLNGWTLAEVVGLKAPYPWWSKDFGEDFVPAYLEAIRQPVGRGEIAALKKNGEPYWIDMNWVSVTEDGEFQYAIVNSVDITERKKAEEKRQAILQTALDGFWICDLEGRFLEVNDSYCTMTGYTREELLKMAIKDIEATEKPEETGQRIKKILEQGSDRFETRHRCKDGRIIDIEISVKYHNIGEGQLTVFVHNITARKKAEKALRESEEKFSKAFRTSPEIIAITAVKEGRYIDVNDSFTLATGYSRDEVLGKTSIDLRIWAKADDRLKMFKVLQKQGRVRNLEIDQRMKSGEIRTWLFSAEPININGEACLIGVSFDITERKLMEKALADEATRRRILIEHSRDGIVILDQNGAVYEANRRFAEMLGYSPEEVLKLNVWDWEYQYPPEQVREMINTVDEAGDHFTTSHRRKDGTIYDVEISTNGAMFSGQKLIFCVCRDISERIRMEQALKESEEKFSLAFRASPASISISRLSDSTFIEVNESFLRDKGYTRDEVIGQSALDLNIWGNIEDRRKIIKTLQEGGKVQNDVLQFRTKSGIIRTGLASADIINIGNEPCLIVLNSDITERKQAEEKLRLLGSVTQQVSDSIMITDPKFRIDYMNRAAQDLFGYSIDEIRGKTLNDFHVVPQDKRISRKVRECINQGKVWCQTIQKKCKDGRVIICDCRLSPLYDEKGRICAYIDVERDVTERKEVEAKLQAQKQLIEGILATMLEGVLVIGSDDRVILANESAHRILHRRHNALNNRPLKDIIPVEPLLKLYHRVKLGEKGGNTLEFRHRVNNTDRICVCGVVKMNGERTLLTFTDVSQEREEKEKLYLTDRLATIGEMAVGLAHELNNPLTGILSLSQLLIDSDIEPETKEDLQCINSEAKRAATIVKNVLLFTRNNNYENGQASVNEVVRDVLRLREYEVKTSNIQVITSLQDNLPVVQIDRFQLQQVFLNIILNAEAAIKDANRPGILTINTAAYNSHVDIAITDNGCGIKKSILPRIFDPFFTTKEIGKGTGLGLSICYGIISKHNGKISVATRVNQGTTFTIRIPAVPEHDNWGT
jgi:two-component system NtrC family sensor kinase